VGVQQLSRRANSLARLDSKS